MPRNEIDLAVTAHNDWVCRFKASLHGTNNEVFDLDKARDEKACDLGKWLASGQVEQWLSPRSISAARMLHGTFHEVSYLIATMFNLSVSLEEVEELIIELDNVSNQLVELLLLAKRNAD